jgi:voltage-dependent potassium channel beta subunit
MATMQYRRLGRSGLKVSELSLGSWVTFGNQLDVRAAVQCMSAAREAGVNFFDNAEVYAGGQAERIMGAALRQMGWPRVSFVVSTKFYWGLTAGPNERNTLNRKYLLNAIDDSLERLGLNYVDVVFCHRADPETPLEETVWAMHDMIDRGKALYWGTSEWTAEEIRGACEVADRHHLHKPVTEQPQYNLFCRQRVEQEYAPLCEDQGIGLTTWSPLASGLLTGKYRDGIEAGSRASLEAYAFLKDRLTDPSRNAIVGQLAGVARDLGCTVGQLAIAWCLKNPHVSTVITGARTAEQVRENMQAVDVAARLDGAVLARVAAIVGSNHE